MQLFLRSNSLLQNFSWFMKGIRSKFTDTGVRVRSMLMEEACICRSRMGCAVPCLHNCNGLSSLCLAHASFFKISSWLLECVCRIYFCPPQHFGDSFMLLYVAIWHSSPWSYHIVFIHLTVDGNLRLLSVFFIYHKQCDYKQSRMCLLVYACKNFASV